MIKEAIRYLFDGKSLRDELMRASMIEIMEGVATPSQIATFLTALRIKGETPQEIYIAASVMRDKAITIKPKTSRLVDTCGTGGSGLYTFNVSTLVALTLASLGIPVAKHGNRSVSSVCGSADIIEALGIPLIKDKDILQKAIQEINFGYIFAPFYHPAMKYATPVRREMGVRTLFNILGPLANPSHPTHQLIGVYDRKLLDTVVNALKKLNLKSALVVHARDGMDEISILGPSDGRLLKKSKISKVLIKPGDFGIKKAKLKELQVKNLNEALSLANSVLEGEESPALDIVALNSGWALFIVDEVSSPQEGFCKAKNQLIGKKVFLKLKQIRAYFKRCST